MEDASEPEPDNTAMPRLDIPGAFTSEILDSETFFAGVANTSPSNNDLPPNLQEAFSWLNGDLWKYALEKELLSLNSNHIYETVPIPAGVMLIISKPVFQIKYNQTRKVERYKVRIITQGFTQHEGVDYQEAFVPVANLESVQIIIALAALTRWTSPLHT